MTCADLIKQLQQFPADNEVVFAGNTGYAQKVALAVDTVFPYRFDPEEGIYVYDKTVVVEIICDEDSSFSITET